MVVPWKKSNDKPRQHIKKQRHHFANKHPYNQSCGFSSSHIQMWELDHEEGSVPKNWCFWTVVLDKTLRSPLESKVIKPISSKGNQTWIFIGRTDVETEVPKLWPPDVKSQHIGKDPDAGKTEGRKRRGWQRMRWHHRLNRHEYEQTPGHSEGQVSLACCSPWGRKELDIT